MKLKHTLVCLFLLFPFISHAEIDQSIPQFIAETAKEYGVDVQMALYVSWHESHWNCDAIGDSSRSYGCWQIFLPAHPTVTKAQAKDLHFSTHWSMQRMKDDGSCKIWTTCPKTDT